MSSLIDSSFLTLSPSTPVLDAVAHLHRTQAKCALVAAPRLSGMFTEQNLVAAIATGKELGSLTLADVITRAPIALHESEAENFDLVLQHFQQHQLQYLPVVNDQGQPVEVISVHATLAALQAQLEQNVLERKQAEVALRRSEQSNHLLFSANPNPMIRLSRDGTYLDYVPAKEFKSFIADSAIQGKTIYQVMPADFAQEQMHYVEKALQTGIAQVYEFELEVEGDRRYQEAQISVSGTDEVLIIVRDVTDRKRIITALLEKEEHLKLALDFTHTGIWHWHIQDNRLVWNENTARLMGLSPDQTEVSVQTWMNCVHPEDLPRVCQNEDYALANHISHNVEYRVIWPDGTVRWMMVKGHGIYDETGEAVRMVGVMMDITDRKLAETALQESEQRLKTILESSPLPIFIKDLQGKYTTVNRAYEQITQLDRSQLLGITDWDLLSADFAQICWDSDQAALLTRQPIVFEEQVPFLDQARDVIVTRFPICDAAGIPYAVGGILTDITDRKQMEAALQQSVQCYRAVVEDQTELIIRYRADTTLTFVNEAFCRYFGVKREEVTGRSYQPVIVSDDRQHVAQLVQSLSAENPVVMIENRVIIANGAIRWTQWINRVILNEQNQIVEFQAVGRDITDRKQIEIALQESEANFRQLASHIQDVFWILSPQDATLLYVSPVFEKIWGRSRESLYRKPYAFIEFIHPDDQNQVRNAIAERDRTGTVIDLEYRIVKPSGEIRWIHDRGFPILNESGQLYRVVGVSIDISDRKQAEAALQKAKEAAEAANQAKSEFLSRMSHELRTPLTSVLGFADLIARDTSLSAEHQENLAIIHRSGTHLLNLINSVLEMSRIEAGEITLDKTSFNLHHLLNNVRDLFQLKAMSKGLALSVTWSPDLPQHVQTDENKLRQVLINLLDNAIKFTETGSVTLKVNTVQQTEAAEASSQQPEETHSSIASFTPILLRFQVKDTGSGIASDELAILFNAFAQTRAGRSLQQGTGLGLAISRQFIRMMGGEITVESQIGQGTTLTFEIPVCVTQMAARSPSFTPQQNVKLAISTTYRILIVEDQTETRKMLIRLLSPIGFEVKEAANGQEAVEMWQSWQPHLIWMDMHMPAMNGDSATREIRTREKLSPTPRLSTKIIALTANAFEQHRSNALAAGCDDFVAKPFRHTEILEKMAEHLGIEYSVASPTMTNPTMEAMPCAVELFNVGSAASPLILPANWSADLRNAALRLHSSQCFKLIAQLPETHSSLAQALIDRVNRFQFNAIVDWVEQLDKG